VCNPLYLFAAIVRRVGWWHVFLDSQWVAWFNVPTQYHLQKHAPLVFAAMRKKFTPPSVSFPDFGDDVFFADGRRVKSRLSSLCRQSHDTMSFSLRYEAQGNMSGGVSRGYYSLCMCLICSNIAELLQCTAIAPVPTPGLTNARGRGVLRMEWEIEK
jgi:hypothetical protein